MSDPFDLERFIAAQADVHEAALAEIRRGRKTSHWMWFIFPQAAGLGHSGMAQRYVIRSLEEARAYLDHPLLGSRLRTCVSALQGLGSTTAEAVFRPVDAMKLHSSLTLFAEVSDERLFTAALERWFEGGKDEATLKLMAKEDR